MPATKKFTARNLPVLADIARGHGFDMDKVDSKTYDLAIPAMKDLHAGVAPGAMSAATFLTDEIERTFAAYDITVDNRVRFVRVSWAKDTRTESQINNCD